MDKRENSQRHLDESKAERKRSTVDMTRAICERIENIRAGNNPDVIKGNNLGSSTVGVQEEIRDRMLTALPCSLYFYTYSYL